MNVVGIIAQKGGAGKTTLAVHLAVAAAQLGRGKGRGRMSMRVLLIDTDEQDSARKWWESRKGKGVDLVAARTLGPALKKIGDDYDLVVVDTAPRAAADTLATIKLCDFILAPCRPGRLDIDAMVDTAAILKMAKKPSFVVLSAVPTVGQAVLTEARQAMTDLGLDCCPVHISQRVSYSHALIDGHSVTEFEPNGRAAGEIKDLWRFTEAQLALGAVASGIGAA